MKKDSSDEEKGEGEKGEKSTSGVQMGAAFIVAALVSCWSEDGG